MTTVTIPYGPGTAIFTVPPTVATMQVTVNGGSGGTTNAFTFPTVKGFGASVSATFNVSPGQIFQIDVGGRGIGSDRGFSTTTAPSNIGGGDGGSNIARTIFAGGGGSGSRILLGVAGPPLIIAGGGGGTGYQDVRAGGDAGSLPSLDGTDGDNHSVSSLGITANGGQGGETSTSTYGAGGTFSITPPSGYTGAVGGAGTANFGGGFGATATNSGRVAVGGGGGGGYFGGGGGAAVVGSSSGNVGGGGGGGSSYVDTASAVIDQTSVTSSVLSTFGDGKVTLQFFIAETPGPSGPIGDTGPSGPIGDIGASGPIGLSGIPGALGPSGPIGLSGIPGALGPSGPIGLSGVPGDLGPSGPIGEFGASGSIGPSGIPGPIGPSGIPGPIGFSGPSGVTGDLGPSGPIGNTGASGSSGLTGPSGEDGVSGPSGPTGPTGPAGSLPDILFYIETGCCRHGNRTAGPVPVRVGDIVRFYDSRDSLRLSVQQNLITVGSLKPHSCRR